MWKVRRMGRELAVLSRLYRRRTEWSVRVGCVTSVNDIPEAIARRQWVFAIDRRSVDAARFDRAVDFIADPFVVVYDTEVTVFAEIMPRWEDKGVVGAWSYNSTDDVLKFEGVALSESYHLSYPFPLRCGKSWYLVPESEACREVVAYRCVEWPTRWTKAGVLLSGIRLADPTVLQWAGRWWLFGASGPDYSHLRLYSSSTVLGPYGELESREVLVSNTAARPGGSIVSLDGELVRFAQSSIPRYGTTVGAYAFSLGEDGRFEQRRYPIWSLAPGEPGSWNATGMHHVSVAQRADGAWWFAVDGRGG